MGAGGVPNTPPHEPLVCNGEMRLCGDSAAASLWGFGVGAAGTPTPPPRPLFVPRGPLNWYRNMRPNWRWALTAKDRKVGTDPAPHPAGARGGGERQRVRGHRRPLAHPCPVSPSPPDPDARADGDGGEGRGAAPQHEQGHGGVGTYVVPSHCNGTLKGGKSPRGLSGNPAGTPGVGPAVGQGRG